MAIPVVQSGFTSNTAVPGSSLSLSKPTGLVAGDLCVVIVGNDYSGGTDAQWDNTTNKPTGFTLIFENGNGPSASHLGAFYRVIDGGESWPISVPALNSEDFWGYAIRVTGVDTASPLNATGTALNQGTDTTSHVIPAVTTVNDDCLCFYALAFDGGDGDPFSVSGTGWTEQAEIEAGTGAGNASGCWGTKDQAAAGSAGTATVTSTASDTSTSRQFAIRGASSGQATVSPNSAGMSV